MLSSLCYEIDLTLHLLPDQTKTRQPFFLPSAFCRVPTTHEVNDLHAIAIADFRLLPIRAPYDLTIYFNSNALGCKRQPLH